MRVENRDNSLNAIVQIGLSQSFVDHGVNAATQLAQAGDMEGAAKLLEESAKLAMKHTKKAKKLLNPKP